MSAGAVGPQKRVPSFFPTDLFCAALEGSKLAPRKEKSKDVDVGARSVGFEV